MSSRESILQDVRRNQPAPEPYPDAPAQPQPGAAPDPADDPTERFADAVRAAGGHFIAASPGVSLDALIAQRFPEARVIASMVAGVSAANLPLESVFDPHDLADLDLFVCEAEFGVAENGALWLAEPALGHRAAPFLAEHLLVVLERRQLVRDLHAAYARLQIDAHGFGLFMAGPSKTADIEQALVIGAHGPRSLTVVLT